MRFTTPQKYVQYIQAKAVATPPTSFDHALDSGFESTGVKPFEILLLDRVFGVIAVNPSVDYALGEYLLLARAPLPKSELRAVRRRVAAGAIASSEKEAYVAKSRDGKVAVVLSHGLLKYLLGSLNLYLARRRPDWYRLAPGVSNLLKADSPRVLRQYAKGDSDSPVDVDALAPVAERRYKLVLSFCLCEMFIVCHELAHFLNGDLRKRFNLKAVGDRDINMLVEGSSYAMEYSADLRACELMWRAFNTAGTMGYPDDEFFELLSSLFEILSQLQPQRTQSHPSPLQRKINLGLQFFPHSFGGMCVPSEYADHPEYAEYSQHLKDLDIRRLHDPADQVGLWGSLKRRIFG